MYISYLEHNILGNIEIIEENDGISKINIGVNKKEGYIESEETIKCKKELIEYFDKKRKQFSIKLEIKGSDFQKLAYLELLKIPYGKTISYQEQAILIGNVRACRAIGNANSKNPIPIIIPCHRVISKNGDIGGYYYDISIKKYLLDLEKE